MSSRVKRIEHNIGSKITYRDKNDNELPNPHVRDTAPRNTKGQPFRHVKKGKHLTKKRTHIRRNGKRVFDTSPHLTQEEMLGVLTSGQFNPHHLMTISRRY